MQLENITTQEMLSLILLVNSLLVICCLIFMCFVVSEEVNKKHLALFIIVFGFSVPIISIFFLLNHIFSLRTAHKKDISFYCELDLPEFIKANSRDIERFSESSAYARITSDQASDKRKLLSLFAVNKSVRPGVNKFNYDILRSDNDELRLFSYGKINNQQTDLFNEIHRCEDLLEAHFEEHDEHSSKVLNLYKLLAYYYWELLFLNLVEDDIQKVSLAKAKYYIEQIEQMAPNELGILVLKARVLIYAGEINEAKSCLQQAARLNAPKSKVFPYLAEIEFKQHNLAAVRQYFGNKKLTNDLLEFRKQMDFWGKDVVSDD